MNFGKTKVAVLRGGPSYAYSDSLKTGAYVLSLLRKMPESYEPLDIFISKDGDWHYGGLVEEPHRILSKIDVVWNAMHGPYGEDGKVQQLLESIKVPFVGSGTLAASFSNNKDLAKRLYRKHALPTPEFEVVSEQDLFNEDKLIYIFRNFGHPVIVKPSTGVRAMSVRMARTFAELKDAVKHVFQHSPKAIVEEYVSGIVASCTVVEGGKGEGLYAFLPTHLKINRRTAKPSVEENKQMEELAKKAHNILGLRHFSSSDFIITPKGKIYLLETNSVPVLHEEALLHQSFKQSGWRPKDFVDHSLRLALGRTEGYLI
ncbi:MAG: ATP-grasp domain-containing protein [Candidatus Zambryskibacteria bacterium]|nr:ATP-grasp domain-containing protein [Candidatus Zambryskibacteria bacterium]